MRGGSAPGEIGERFSGGWGDVDSEFACDAFWDCWSLLSLKYSSAGSAGEEIWARDRGQRVTWGTRGARTEAARACGAWMCGTVLPDPRSTPNFSSFSSIICCLIASHELCG